MPVGIVLVEEPPEAGLGRAESGDADLGDLAEEQHEDHDVRQGEDRGHDESGVPASDHEHDDAQRDADDPADLDDDTESHEATGMLRRRVVRELLGRLVERRERVLTTSEHDSSRGTTRHTDKHGSHF